MNLFEWDKLNRILIFKDLLAFCWCKRSGYDFTIQKSCGIEFTRLDCIHMRHIYIHILNYGGYVAWKSQICYQ
jgi:hypothetical protein